MKEKCIIVPMFVSFLFICFHNISLFYPSLGDRFDSFLYSNDSVNKSHIYIFIVYKLFLPFSCPEHNLFKPFRVMHCLPLMIPYWQELNTLYILFHDELKTKSIHIINPDADALPHSDYFETKHRHHSIQPNRPPHHK